MKKQKQIVTGCDEGGLFTISKLFTLLLLILSLSLAAQTATIKDAKGNYTAVHQSRVKSVPIATGKTFTTAKGEVFPVFTNKNGRHFVIRTSKNTGKSYNQYLD